MNNGNFNIIKNQGSGIFLVFLARQNLASSPSIFQQEQNQLVSLSDLLLGYL